MLGSHYCSLAETPVSAQRALHRIMQSMHAGRSITAQCPLFKLTIVVSLLLADPGLLPAIAAASAALPGL
jgi:hypothetical protein